MAIHRDEGKLISKIDGTELYSGKDFYLNTENKKFYFSITDHDNIDGVKAAEALNKGLKPIDRKPYFIGAMYRGAEGSRSYENFMDGYIDDYLVYNRAFTAAEAKALYDSMK